MKRAVVLILIVATGVALYMLTDLESMSSALLSMAGETLLFLIALLIINEIVKGIRWAFLLRASGLQIRYRDGLTSYLAAQVASAVPGGSMLSVRLAAEHGHIRMHRAASGFVGQAIADVWAISLLAVMGIMLTQQRQIQLAIPLVAIALSLVAVAIVRSPRLTAIATALVSRWRLTQRFLSKETEFLSHSAALMRPKTLGIGMGISTLSTFISAITLLLITGALTARGMTVGEALYTHTIGIIARMAIPVPGGYGVSDASLAGMLNFIGIGFARATFIALAYRTVGLLFRTILGLFMLIVRYPYILIGPLDAPRTQPQPAGIRRFAPRPWTSRPVIAILKRTSFAHATRATHIPRAHASGAANLLRPMASDSSSKETASPHAGSSR